MADVNSDVLVLGACIMDFIWFVLSYSFNHRNHPRCHIILIRNFVLFFSCSYAHHLPKAGETIKGTKFETGYGGKDWTKHMSIRRDW